MTLEGLAEENGGAHHLAGDYFSDAEDGHNPTLGYMPLGDGHGVGIENQPEAAIANVASFSPDSVRDLALQMGEDEDTDTSSPGSSTGSLEVDREHVAGPSNGITLETAAVHNILDTALQNTSSSTKLGSCIESEELELQGLAADNCNEGNIPSIGPAADIELTEEHKAAILGAMKNFSLGYTPDWVD